MMENKEDTTILYITTVHAKEQWKYQMDDIQGFKY